MNGLTEFEMSASRTHEVNEFTLGLGQATSKKISNDSQCNDAMMPDPYDLNEFTLMGGGESSIHHQEQEEGADAPTRVQSSQFSDQQHHVAALILSMTDRQFDEKRSQ